MAKTDLTAQRLRELLHYDPETGVFTWKVKRRAYRGRVYPGDEAGSPHGNGYVEIGIDGCSHYAHRLAWLYMTGEWPGHQVDHHDRCRTNNVWDNLRPASSKQNQENRTVRKDSLSGHKGVSHLPSGRWRAIIRHNYTRTHIGVFDTIEQAIRARKDAEATLFTHGEPQAESLVVPARLDAI